MCLEPERVFCDEFNPVESRNVLLIEHPADRPLTHFSHCSHCPLRGKRWVRSCS